MPYAATPGTEVVEDSEPEREASREAQKLERKKKKLASKAIVISDGSARASPPRHISSPINVIEISDSSVSINRNVISMRSSVTGVDVPVNSPDGTGTLPPAVTACHSDEEEIVPTLNLARFTFKNGPRPLQPRNSASTTESASNADTQAKSGARRSSKHLAGEFSDAELKKLGKCIGCGIAWTTRKSAAQKMVHIRSCAKKNGLTDDTVGFLIRKEIENAPEISGTSKGKAPLANAATPTTLLEDVVREAAPKRKGKRIGPIDTLKTVSETRQNILGRARILLGTGPLSDEDGFTVQTEAVASDAVVIAKEQQPPTQAFGTSRLAQRHPYKPMLPGGQDSNGEPDLLPATQAFVSSKLGGRTVTRTFGWGYDSDPGDEASPNDSPKRTSGEPLDFPTSAKEASQSSSLKTKGNTTAAAPHFALQLPSEGCTDDENDVYVHFDPAHDDGEIHMNSMTLDPFQNTKGSKNVSREGLPKAKRTLVLAESDEHGAAPRSPNQRKRRKNKTEEELNESALKVKIMEDRDLHLRILRYEPINFETFLQLVIEPGQVAGGRLKQNLRSFLDKQTINFYDGETGRTRKR
ncbi:hypothetical protein GGX14DRAFT_613319 [Mycena pura]|uniref:Structure-specific endonuclease subunit SLX4 n=1 Tax=Mycena pura TaxID=153505 RepID=A0AAD6YSL0_9AGAR|nr:hypothetical protein GGX14DRAFT_613319 [Mycena pura]